MNNSFLRTPEPVNDHFSIVAGRFLGFFHRYLQGFRCLKWVQVSGTYFVHYNVPSRVVTRPLYCMHVMFCQRPHPWFSVMSLLISISSWSFFHTLHVWSFSIALLFTALPFPVLLIPCRPWFRDHFTCATTFLTFVMTCHIACIVFLFSLQFQF